jgi:uncharacterized protein YdhG (YjbR/CyaY superfamily)
LESVRQTILAAAPGIDETIRYNIPTYTVRGKALVHFAGKSTLRFSLALPIPLELVTSVVRHLLAERF